MNVSQFWRDRIAYKPLGEAWKLKDQEIRAEWWNHATPAEFISYSRYKRLPVARRRAIEAALYERAD